MIGAADVSLLVMQHEERAPPVPRGHATAAPVGRWRTHLAFVVALAGRVLAGYALSFAGFGFFPMWVFFTFFAPPGVFGVSVRRHLLVATLDRERVVLGKSV